MSGSKSIILPKGIIISARCYDDMKILCISDGKGGSYEAYKLQYKNSCK